LDEKKLVAFSDSREAAAVLANGVEADMWQENLRTLLFRCLGQAPVQDKLFGNDSFTPQAARAAVELLERLNSCNSPEAGAQVTKACLGENQFAPDITQAVRKVAGWKRDSLKAAEELDDLDPDAGQRRKGEAAARVARLVELAGRRVTLRLDDLAGATTSPL